MKNIAIIPLRGGSIRVPRKNVKEFCGRPLRTIEAALGCGLIDDVYVSTDDDEIENIALWYPGVHVIRRPDWSDADKAAANRPLLHAVNEIGGDFRMITLFATSPQRRPDDIGKAILLHMDTGGQVSALHRKRETFIYRDKDGMVAETYIADKFQKHFDLASGLATVNNSAWYRWFNARLQNDTDEYLNNQFRSPRDMPNNQIYYTEVEAWQVPETDSPEEFALCELIMQNFILRGTNDPYGTRP